MTGADFAAVRRAVQVPVYELARELRVTDAAVAHVEFRQHPRHETIERHLGALARILERRAAERRVVAAALRYQEGPLAEVARQLVAAP